ncbi:hypothetical protein VTJ04DRAFT_6718 [Mycothermus thermophilus]|uniref:uncharacterized protein n=1 Tax=Humicola insolens TaxID=85995 RepID=UPI0037432C5F
MNVKVMCMYGVGGGVFFSDWEGGLMDGWERRERARILFRLFLPDCLYGADSFLFQCFFACPPLLLYSLRTRLGLVRGSHDFRAQMERGP